MIDIEKVFDKEIATIAMENNISKEDFDNRVLVCTDHNITEKHIFIDNIYNSSIKIDPEGEHAPYKYNESKYANVYIGVDYAY